MIATAIRVRVCALRSTRTGSNIFGVEQSDVYDTIRMLLGGVPVGYSYRGAERTPIGIVIGLPKSDLAWTERLTSTPVPANVLPGSNRGRRIGRGRPHRRRSRARRLSSGATAILPIW